MAAVNVGHEAAVFDIEMARSSANSTQFREVYKMATVEGVFTGNRTTLNGNELIVEGTRLPPLNPVFEKGAMEMAPLSVAFVMLPDARAPACVDT